MRQSLLALLAGLSSLASACASSGWHTYAYSPSPKPAKLAEANGEKVLCRDDAPTGTLLPKRECHTASEWDRLDADSMNQFNQEAARSLPTTDPGSSTGR
jgi:hypothetical protein